MYSKVIRYAYIVSSPEAGCYRLPECNIAMTIVGLHVCAKFHVKIFVFFYKTLCKKHGIYK